MILVVIFLVLFSTKIVFGFGLAGNFAGRIIYTKAIKIKALESAGFVCVVPGSSIQIKPIGLGVGTPTTYLIPFAVKSRTKYPLKPFQKIMGKYAGKAIITCTNTGTGATTTVTLTPIILFGTSKL